MKNYLSKKDKAIIIAVIILGVVASVVYIWHNSIGFLLLSMAWCAGIIWASKYITRMISQYNYLHQDFRDICNSNEDYEKRENELRCKLGELQDKFDIAMTDNRKKDETIKDYKDTMMKSKRISAEKDAEILDMGNQIESLSHDVYRLNEKMKSMEKVAASNLDKLRAANNTIVSLTDYKEQLQKKLEVIEKELKDKKWELRELKDDLKKQDFENQK